MPSALISDLEDAEQIKEVNLLLDFCEKGDHAGAKRIIQNGNLPSLSLQDDDGWTALHYATNSGNKDLVEFLLSKGALWSMIDKIGHTAGDIAFSYNDSEIYSLIFDEGLRSEMLRLTLVRKFKQKQLDGTESEENNEGSSSVSDNAKFLSSKLTYQNNSVGQPICVDEEGNAVMMGWESMIMKETAQKLCSGLENSADFELSVLNIGFGLGIIDGYLQSYRPARHVIVEAHPDVLSFMRQNGWHKKPGVVIYPGRWQSFLKEIEDGSIEGNFDVVYWDTFSENYDDLKVVFDNLFSLLSGPNARFSWFHGLGATSRTIYDIYTEIAEIDLRDAGLKISWYEVDVGGGEAIWEGIKRRYWNIPCRYRLPICRYDV
ncbi:S-adenosyl-L-methionine-dependent methyltransferase [Phakopsora pachyrhizi]|uniref:Arginine N-methyltransferase 2 n=1 Tax=Phakopsora pachyrhizi TaxID=170000 RepID=A0AAV0BS35_PHAPC|nr:S-adenosyl-L-methionine-dependent methyltransferase [Phakopsora pachyrhizi]CAH7689487.1 S-adenosyl-L-methionine-dependent methyltransferase [Phakopsora pachyrhizi]